MNIELLIISICFVVGSLTFLDIFMYMIKKAPKAIFFNDFVLYAGERCMVVVVYYILNRYNLY